MQTPKGLGLSLTLDGRDLTPTSRPPKSKTFLSTLYHTGIDLGPQLRPSKENYIPVVDDTDEEYETDVEADADEQLNDEQGPKQLSETNVAEHTSGDENVRAASNPRNMIPLHEQSRRNTMTTTSLPEASSTPKTSATTARKPLFSEIANMQGRSAPKVSPHPKHALWKPLSLWWR